MRVLVVNAGSSSVKLRVVEADDTVELSEDLGPPGAETEEQLVEFVSRAGPIDAAGHRIVHGGTRFDRATVVDAQARAALGTLNELAPLHNPPALAALDAMHKLCPSVPAVASFDTGFHARLSHAVTTYALPAQWRQKWSLRRYGFHGLSCSWSAARSADWLGPTGPANRIVVCHLGSGASVTAIVDGRSVDTTMGFTPIEGLIMATRPGDVDPGVLTWLIDHGIDRADLDDALEHRSGLAALCDGSSGDMRDVLDRRDHGDPQAGRALEVYLHRLRAKIAAMAAASAGLDVLVFTGGIGEHSPVIRAETAKGLAWIGVDIDERANRDATADAEISRPGSQVRVVVIEAREDLVMAADCRRLLGSPD